MTEFTAINKEEAGKQLPLIIRKIADVAKSINRFDGILLLLVLEDAIDNVSVSLAKVVAAKETELARKLQEKPAIRLGLLNFIREWYHLIDLMISEVYQHGTDDSPEINTTPEIGFGIGVEEDPDSYKAELRRVGEIQPGDLVLTKPRKFLNRIDGFFVIVTKSALGQPLESKVMRMLTLRDLFYQKGLLETVLGVPDGAYVRFTDDGLRQITLPPNVTPESILGKGFITLRHAETMTTVMDWHSRFRDVAEETLKLVERGRGPVARRALMKETEQISRAYCRLPKFPKTFKTNYGFQLPQFLKNMTALSMESLKRPHTIIKASPNRLEALVSKIAGTSRQNAKRFIDFLTFPDGEQPIHCAFLKTKGWILTSFVRINRACLHRVEDCFSEVYDNDLKGKAFERGCRELLKRNHFIPYPGRIKVKEPMIPQEVSLTLWERAKKSSDVDVLANDNNILLLLECKEIKSHRIRLKETKQFQKFLTELYFKAHWVATNLKRLETYAWGSFEKNIGIKTAEPIFLFPILVCNLYVDTEEWMPVPFLTFTELRKLTSDRSWCCKKEGGNSGTSVFNLGSQEVSLPWFRCKY